MFRYDNAADPRAKKVESVPHHKHTAEGTIVASKEKNLEEVLDEIEETILGRLE